MFRYAPEWDGKKSTGVPKTFVVVPKEKKSFTLDVKYADYTGVFDTYDQSRKPECYVIPPYKPVMYMYASGASMDVYSLTGKTSYCHITSFCVSFTSALCLTLLFFFKQRLMKMTRPVESALTLMSA